MSSLDLAIPDTKSTELPVPFLMNTWKHHAGVIRQHIFQASQMGAPGLTWLQQEIRIIGQKLMDLYYGPLTPTQLAEELTNYLQTHHVWNSTAYRQWIANQGGYAKATLSDTSQWVFLSTSDTDRYIHLHPGRWVPWTVRVRANVLKTAIFLTTYGLIHGAPVTDLETINSIRQHYLGLCPLGQLPLPEEGLGIALQLLQQPLTQPLPLSIVAVS